MVGATTVGIEQEMRELRAEVERLREKLDWKLPLSMKKERAAEQLDISTKTLNKMIRRQEILTVRVCESELVPASEVIRLSTPKPRTKKAERNSTARNAKGYAAEILKLARKKKS